MECVTKNNLHTFISDLYSPNKSEVYIVLNISELNFNAIFKTKIK